MAKALYLVLLLGCLAVLGGCSSKYKVVSTTNTSSTISFVLNYTGTDEYYLKPTSPIIKNLVFTLHCYSFSDFGFKIVDAANSRFEVPQEGVFPIDPVRNFSFPINLAGFRFEHTDSPFDFRIIRKSNNATLFSTYDGELIFSNYYLQIVTEIDSDYTYGLGERFNTNTRLQSGKWTIFNRDRGQVRDDGKGLQTYGYYPFYLQRENANRLFHINYFRSSNAMDVISESKSNKHYLTYKVIGGIFDFRFFLGEQSAQLTIEKFHNYLGRSAIPPFWSLGFHQCRWGYRNVSYLEDVIKGYESNNIPLDTIWSDIDYMIDYEDFTIDESKFPLNRMSKILQKYHYVPIIDAGIKVNDGVAYNEGVKRGVFVKDANGSQLRGRVWPGTTTFVDFFHPNATAYWGDMLDLLYQKVKFSGIWLDMNEYANFCDGPCEKPTSTGFDFSNDLPYNPGSDSIEAHTIPLNSTHYGSRKQADVHAFGAFLQTYATNLFLKSKGLRPFIITRSSTLGSNKFGFHWTGDNYANFQFLKSSIADNFLNQLWGFQMVGPDICGFGGNTNEELCSRWFQLGSLYTFTRNHNDFDSKSQQPYALGDVVLQAARNNLKLKYSLLKHYYNLFVSKRGLGTIFNPLFLIFPTDNNNYIDQITDSQFLIGNNLMAAPILQQGVTSRNVYFTTTHWYDFYTGKRYAPGTARIDNVKLTDLVPLFIRENSIVFTQNVDNVRQSNDLNNQFTMVAALFFESQRSDAEHRYYRSSGAHISLGDYSNDSQIDDCLARGCEYGFNIELLVTQNVRTLSVNTTYGGAVGLNKLFIINKVVLYYPDGTATTTLVNPIEVNGPIKIVIPVNDEPESTGRKSKTSLQIEEK